MVTITAAVAETEVPTAVDEARPCAPWGCPEILIVLDPKVL
jgi:hypothetical protein